jgi:hypothetical protein
MFLHFQLLKKRIFQNFEKWILKIKGESVAILWLKKGLLFFKKHRRSFV